MGNVFSDRKQKLNLLKALRKTGAGNVTDAMDVFQECPACQAKIPLRVIRDHYDVCVKCGYYFKMSYKKYYSIVFDEGTVRELFLEIKPKNPIGFPEYENKLRVLSEKTSMRDACVCAEGNIGGIRTVCVVLDSSFLMGSMGTAVGEKITKAAEYAAKIKTPLIIFSASGGARMQEGIFSLMQMAKTAAAVKRFLDSGGFYISYLTHPTTGGVTASFASLGDIILAEPGALIGFAGPRVIEQTIGKKLPKGFQRSEFLLEHGFVDAIVRRTDLKQTLTRLLYLHWDRRDGYEY